jgi:ferredoxin
MDHKSFLPYPKNSPGPFYVEKDCCISCQAPYQEAPDLMAHDEDGGHCFFRQQPETPEEVERAIRACRISCVSAVRYSGDAPEILRRFRELRRTDACDVLCPQRLAILVQDKRWESLWMKEKLAIARRAVEVKRNSPQETGDHPLFDRELDG